MSARTFKMSPDSIDKFKKQKDKIKFPPASFYFEVILSTTSSLFVSMFGKYRTITYQSPEHFNAILVCGWSHKLSMHRSSSRAQL
jgi:hypothetical protein